MVPFLFEGMDGVQYGPQGPPQRVLSRWEVQLTPAAGAEMSELAERFQAANDDRGMPDGRMTDDLDGANIHYVGNCGELAFCEMLGLEMDRTVGPRVGGADVVINSVRIDTKTRPATRKGDDLLVPIGEKRKASADIYVQMLGGPVGVIRFAGWAPAHAVWRSPIRNLTGNGESYVYPVEDLSAPESLMPTVMAGRGRIDV